MIASMPKSWLGRAAALAVAAIAAFAAPALAQEKLTAIVWNTQMNGTVKIDPHKISNPVAQAAIGAMYDTLYRFEGADVSKPVPNLATSYTVSPDYKVWTFKLNKAAKFADGTPVTSADVLWTFERMRNLLSVASTFTPGLTMTAPDPETVVITSELPNPGLLVTLTTYNFAVLNSKLLTANGGAAAPGANEADKSDAYMMANSVGSGPYKLESFAATERMVLVPNPNYWGEKKAAFSRIVIVNTPSQQQLLNVRAGVAQIALELSSSQVEGIPMEATPRLPLGLQLDKRPAVRQFFLTFNMQPVNKDSVSANPDFRRAVRYALDWNAILRLAGDGAVLGTGFIPQIVPGALPAADAPKQDIEKAKEYLKKSGLTNPTVTLTYPTNSPLNGMFHADFAQQIQADLGKIGVTVTLRGLPNATAFPEHATGRTEMALFTYSRPPDLAVYATAYCPGPQPAAGSQQSLPFGWIRWVKGTDPEMDKLCAEAIAAAPDKRVAAAQAMVRYANENGPYLGLFEPAVYVLSDKRLSNAVSSPAHGLDLRLLGTQ